MANSCTVEVLHTCEKWGLVVTKSASLVSEDEKTACVYQDSSIIQESSFSSPVVLR